MNHNRPRLRPGALATCLLMLFPVACATQAGSETPGSDTEAGGQSPSNGGADERPDEGADPDPVVEAQALTEIDAGDFALTTDMDGLAPALAALEDELGTSQRRSVDQMMDNANRESRDLCNSDAYEPVEQRAGDNLGGFCWNEGDDDVDYWYPQGTTTAGDATAEGSYEGRQVVAASWYHKPEGDPSTNADKGVRISFYDAGSDDEPGNYRHVLLVEPTLSGDTADFQPVTVHAGGIAWYGNHLYVADTRQGFRIFDVDRIYAVETGDKARVGRQSDGTYHAFDYSLVLPQVGWARDSGDAALRYSFVSLDRSSSPHSLVAGEYAPPEGGDTRVVRFPLDETSALPISDADGVTYGTEAYDTGLLQMQGVATYDDRWWFASSNGRGSGPTDHYGLLRVWDVGEPSLRAYEWAYGPEDLSYWADPDGPDRLWTNTEYPTYRTVFAAPVDAFD